VIVNMHGRTTIKKKLFKYFSLLRSINQSNTPTVKFVIHKN
jgi:hypothetical protein